MNIQPPREYWPRWAELLKRFQLDHFAAWMLEAGGPLALLGAQALYFGRGFLGMHQMDALARTLEDDSEVHAFAAYLQAEGAALRSPRGGSRRSKPVEAVSKGPAAAYPSRAGGSGTEAPHD